MSTEQNLQAENRARESLAESAARGLGAAAMGMAQEVGAMSILLGKTLRAARHIDREEFVKHAYRMAFKSLPIVVVTALFSGAIMVVQAGVTVRRLNAEGQLGWGAGFSTVREIAPLLCALMMSGRIGANNTAELGTMVVTEQLDALRVLAIDPIKFLVGPRFFAIVLTVVSMTIFADAIALLGASYTGLALLGIEPMTFYNSLTGGMIHVSDLMNGIFKSLFFGTVVALSSCYYGISTTGGSPGVGRAVNATVVVSAAGVFVLDYFVSFLLP